jgi:hypothetical protein
VKKRSYDWFEQRRRTRGLELAHEQITKAFDTVIGSIKQLRVTQKETLMMLKNSLKTCT